MQFSAPAKKHWLGSFSIVLPPSGLRGFVPVVREQGRPGARGPGPGGGGDTRGGGGWGVGGNNGVYLANLIFNILLLDPITMNCKQAWDLII